MLIDAAGLVAVTTVTDTALAATPATVGDWDDIADHVVLQQGDASMTYAIHGVAIPDTELARAVTDFVRDTESDLLFNHSSPVYYFGALAGLAWTEG